MKAFDLLGAATIFNLLSEKKSCRKLAQVGSNEMLR